MKQHSGMRPHDIVVLLKIISKGNTPWRHQDLSNELFISQSEISESLHRSQLAGLIDVDKKKVYRQSLLDFIEYGLRYVYPVKPGSMVNGIYTAHSHPFMQQQFKSEVNYVWPSERGPVRGLSIEPLYKDVVKAAISDEKLYKMLALIDIMRVGRTRELKIAIGELHKMIINEPQR
jgi:predicted transcriptional regulator